MTKETKGSHSAALITGRIERYPSKITSRTGKKRIAKRSKIKPFVKLINYNHSMPTRYSLEGIDQLKTQLGNESLNEVWQKDEARKVVKKSFEEKFPVCRGFDEDLANWSRLGRIGGSLLHLDSRRL